jgi:hypothetical protein
MPTLKATLARILGTKSAVPEGDAEFQSESSAAKWAARREVVMR